MITMTFKLTNGFGEKMTVEMTVEEGIWETNKEAIKAGEPWIAKKIYLTKFFAEDGTEIENKRKYHVENATFNVIGKHELVAVDNEMEEGDGATWHGWSDAHAGTIIKRKGKTIVWRGDNAKLLNGPESGEPDALKVYPGGFAAHWEGRQRYEYSPNENGSVYTFTLRKNGKWVRKGEGMKNGATLTAGRHEHYDYNF